MSKKYWYLLFVLIALSVTAVVVYSAKKKRPRIVLANPEDGAQMVSAYTPICVKFTDLPKGGIDRTTLNNETVFLVEQKTGVRVPATIRYTTGNVITLVPDAALSLSTSYILKVTGRVKDCSGNSISPYHSVFTTGAVADSGLLSVGFDKLPLPTTSGRYTCLTIGPDHKLYALGLEGAIKRFIINTDGTLGAPEEIFTLQDAYGSRQQRLAVGLAFDPASTASNLVAYVTHCTMTLTDAPDWDCKLSRISGSNLQHFQDVLVNLPRSSGDHLSNSIVFGPDGALYFPQGSNTAMGKSDKTWNYREEHLLTAALLRLDLKKMVALPLDVRTKDGGGTYDPFAPGAPLTIYATGLRNPYDLLWHSNGKLYIPNNGSSAGGNTPASVAGTTRPDGSTYTGPKVPPLANVRQSQHDFLHVVVKGGYYGHPNPLRGEFVMNGGNPSAAADPAQVDIYPVGTLPDPRWGGIAFDFQNHKSPNGLIEYKSNVFDEALKGKILIARFSTNHDIAVLTPASNNHTIVGFTDGSSIEGFSGFAMPLDLTEDLRTGNIYVAEFGGSCITLLKPKKLQSSSGAELVHQR